MTETTTDARHADAERPFFAHAMRVLAVPIILGWILVAVVVSTIAPTLEVVGETHSSPMAPKDAPSLKAMMLMGHNFKEFDSNSTVMIVVEGQQQARRRTRTGTTTSILGKLRQDPQHIQHIQDFWGDPLTAAGAQSADAKGAYVMMNLAGEQGTTLANESVAGSPQSRGSNACPARGQGLCDRPGRAHLLISTSSANASLKKITLFTLVAIAIMLFLVYRSITTTLIQLFMTLIELAVSWGVIAVLGNYGLIELAVFATSLLTMLAIAAGTDYGIFPHRTLPRGTRDR